MLAADEALMRAGLRTVLESAGTVRVVGEAGDRDGMLAAVDRHRPDVVLVDVQMPGAGGLPALRVLCARLGRRPPRCSPRSISTTT